MTSRQPNAAMSTDQPKSSVPPRSKNWLLLKFREWHIQAGVVVALFLLSVGATGIYLNHKRQFNAWLGLEAKPPGKAEHPAPKLAPAMEGFTVDAVENALPVSFPRALAIVGEKWGDRTLEHVQLKSEQGELIYKAKEMGGGELWVNATTGAVVEKGKFTKLGPLDKHGKRTESWDWGKFAIELHTGKLFGEAGKVVMSTVSFVMLTLTVSGLYLWAVPKWRKWRARQPALAARVRQGLPSQLSVPTSNP